MVDDGIIDVRMMMMMMVLLSIDGVDDCGWQLIIVIGGIDDDGIIVIGIIELTGDDDYWWPMIGIIGSIDVLLILLLNERLLLVLLIGSEVQTVI